MKKCLHFFISDWRNELARDIPPPPPLLRYTKYQMKSWLAVKSLQYRHLARPAVWALIFGLFLLQAWFMLDPDFGWHLQSGRYFLEHGIPASDIFTYTATDFPWVNHEWLSDVGLALIYSLGGFDLLAVVYAAMWTAAVGLAGRKIHPVFLLAASCAILPFTGVRALTWSVVALVLLMVLLQQVNRRWRYLIPLLFLVWANVHGSFLVGIAYGGWQVLRERSWRLAIIGLVSLGLTFVTPYGHRLYGEIFQTMLDSSLGDRIAEWSSLALPLGAVGYILIWIGLVAARNGRDWYRYVRFDTLLLVMSVASLRMLPLFVVVSLPYLAADIKQLSRRLDTAGALRRQRQRVQSIALWSVAIIVPLLMIIEMIPRRDNFEPMSYPNQAISHLREHPCQGNLFNSYDFGGYLIWKLPSHQVYIDGRMPSWQHEGAKYMDNYLDVLDMPDYRDDQFEKYNINCVLVLNNFTMIDDLTSQGWQVRVDDGRSSLLTRY